MKRNTLAGLLILLLSACGEDDSKPKTLPEVATSPVVILNHQFTIPAHITSIGNDKITAVGIVYSSTSQLPTLTDSKAEASVGGDSFSVTLLALPYATNYYARAYATNSVGTGYGNVITFNTGSTPPTATTLSITGTVAVGSTLTATYTYADAENDPETNSIITWYSAATAAGDSEVAIPGATGTAYTITDNVELRYIRFGVTPKAANGTGTEVKSTFTAVVPEVTSVTFTYNGSNVTYGIIKSAVTGRKWLDRNLGAAGIADSVADYEDYGDLFQWGRGADGHQRINRTGWEDADMIGVHGTTTTLADKPAPGHNQFIITTGVASGDWLTPQNSNLWQGVAGVNNPCPAGWRIPTQAEWDAEAFVGIKGGFEKLKLTYTGFRLADGTFLRSHSHGAYATSNTTISDTGFGLSTMVSWDKTAFRLALANNRGVALACRCIKNQ